jgi:hypothetical protein
VTRAETIGAIPPLTLYVVIDHTRRCSPLIFNSKDKIDNIRLNCVFYVTPCRNFLRSMQDPGKIILWGVLKNFSGKKGTSIIKIYKFDSQCLIRVGHIFTQMFMLFFSS